MLTSSLSLHSLTTACVLLIPLAVYAGYFQENEAWYLCFDPTLMSVALLVALAFDFSKRLPQTAHPALSSPAVHDKSDLEMQHSGGKHVQVMSPSSNVTNGGDQPE